MRKLIPICALALLAFIGIVWAGQTASPDPGEVDLYEKFSNGTNYVGLKAPDSISGNSVWTLPVSDAPGFWKSDGAGHLSIVPAVPVAAVLTVSLITQRITAENVPMPGMTPAGHCALTATNSTAGATLVNAYVSVKSANQITVAHARIAGLKYDILCTPN